MKMTRAAGVRDNVAAYALLLVLFSFVVTYQVRSSLETVHLQRHLDFYVPFLLEPFTNRIGISDHFASWELGGQFDVEHYSVLHPGDEVLSVNGRPLRGMSMYLKELLKAEYYPNPLPIGFRWYPFVLTARSSASGIHRVEIGFPQCTCGIPSRVEAAMMWCIAPLFCVLFGFLVAGLHPRSLLAWAFLVLMLSLSQLQLWREWYPGFQETSTALAWSDWLRIPAVAYRTFVQHAWAAALLIASAHFCRKRKLPRRAALVAGTLFLAYAALQACLQVAWSEDYQMLVSLHHVMIQHATELMLASTLTVALLGWSLNRSLGIVLTASSLLAAAALYGHTAPTPISSIPPSFVVLVFSAVCLLACLVVLRNEITIQEVAAALLWVPGVIYAAGSFGGYWYPYRSQPWLWLVLVSSGLGVLAVSWSVHRRIEAVAS